MTDVLNGQLGHEPFSAFLEVEVVVVIKRSHPDWEAIDREYRAGQISIREIARQHGISDGAIRKRAMKENWLRSLADHVRLGVRDKLVREDGAPSESEGPLARDDRDIADAAISRGVEVVRQHRASLARANRVVDRLLEHLEDALKSTREIEAAIIEETPALENEDAADRRARLKCRATLLKAMSLPSLAQTAASLSTTLKNVIALERQAFNLDEAGSGGDSEVSLLERLSREISGNSFRPVQNKPSSLPA
jgi:hypothetical protein